MNQDIDLRRLKTAVKSLAAKGQTTQREISELRRTRPPKGTAARADHGIAIQGAVARKKSIGYCSRYHQLAYAFARGVPYQHVEQKTRPGNEPSARVVLDVLLDFAEGELGHVVKDAMQGRTSLMTSVLLSTRLADIGNWLRDSVQKAA